MRITMQTITHRHSHSIQSLSPVLWAAGIVLLIPIVVLAGIAALIGVAAPAMMRRSSARRVVAVGPPVGNVILLSAAVARRQRDLGLVQQRAA